MKTIQVELTGTTALLMNSPKGMLLPKSAMTKKTEKYDWKEEAEKVCYRNEKGNLFIPSQAIKGCLINASSFNKIGKYSAKPIIAGGVRVNPVEIEILDMKNKPIKNYEIDMRTVVIQRARVVKARPTIKKWKASFQLLVNDQMIAEDEIVKSILKEAGERIGILDFRPVKGGDFGCFEISSWKILK